jgi:sec-independent protein translocase protein TatB
MMKPMSFSETVFLFVLALVIFGPKKLPEIARQVGKWMNEFRRASNEFKSQIEQEIAHIEVEERKRTMLPPSPAPTGTSSRTSDAATAEGAGSSDTKSPEVPADTATLASTEPTPPQHSAEPATEALGPAETVTSSTSQESHA